MKSSCKITSLTSTPTAQPKTTRRYCCLRS